MKNFLFLSLLTLIQGCWICPESHSVEYNAKTKTLKVLSEGYYIESVKLTEYIPKEGYIEEIDSNYTKISQTSNKVNRTLNLLNLNKNYIAKGKNIQNLLDEKELVFEIIIIKPGKTKNLTETDYINFASENLTDEIMIWKSSGGCK
jgi:hypothetical protein